MGVKRFLVVGGMASLVLIGIVLMVDAKGLAKNGDNPSQVKGPGVGKVPVPDQVPANWDSPREARGNLSKLPVPTPPDGTPPDGPDGTPPDGTPPDGPDGTPPGGPDGTPPGGGGDTGMELAMGAGGADGAGGDGVAGGTGGDGGAGGATATPTALPDTGGPSVVLLPTAGPLLLAMALLLGSGLWVAAFARSVRS
jgi:hypothetical protein